VNQVKSVRNTSKYDEDSLPKEYLRILLREVQMGVYLSVFLKKESEIDCKANFTHVSCTTTAKLIGLWGSIASLKSSRPPVTCYSPSVCSSSSS